MDRFLRLPRWAQYVVVVLVGVLIFGAAWFAFLSDQSTTLQSRRNQRGT